MAATNATNARKNLFRLMEQVNEDHEPVLITGKKGSVVLVSESDWQAIEETLFLNAIPGMADSIRDGMNTSVDDLGDQLDW